MQSIWTKRWRRISTWKQSHFYIVAFVIYMHLHTIKFNDLFFRIQNPFSDWIKLHICKIHCDFICKCQQILLFILEIFSYYVMTTVINIIDIKRFSERRFSIDWFFSLQLTIGQFRSLAFQCAASLQCNVFCLFVAKINIEIMQTIQVSLHSKNS